MGPLIEVGAFYDLAVAEFVFGLHDDVAIVALRLAAESGEIAFCDDDHVEPYTLKVLELRKPLSVGGENRHGFWTVGFGKVFFDQLQQRRWNFWFRHRSILLSRVQWR